VQNPERREHPGSVGGAVQLGTRLDVPTVEVRVAARLLYHEDVDP
jgi:hypothetical protein